MNKVSYGVFFETFSFKGKTLKEFKKLILEIAAIECNTGIRINGLEVSDNYIIQDDDNIKILEKQKSS